MTNKLSDETARELLVAYEILWSYFSHEIGNPYCLKEIYYKAKAELEGE